MKYERVIREDFKSLGELVRVLEVRPKNEIMRNENSSYNNGQDFTGTRSYAQAKKMVTDGYYGVIKTLKDDVKAKSQVNTKWAEDLSHPIPHTAPVGFCPCVPNAIRGLPNSMISVDRKPMKRKTLSILFSMGANCGTRASWFTEAGSALLSAVDIIEKSGIQTQIKLNFFPSANGNELTFPTVVIKNYGERYSLQKISFPLAHPSMFRRIGFKWLETTPDITEKGFANGYGHSPSFDEIEENIKTEPNTYLISAEYIHRHGCSVTEILKKLEVIT